MEKGGERIMYLTQKLADYVAGLRYEEIPEAAKTAAKRCVLDALANMIYGRYTDTGIKALEYIRKYSDSSTKSVEMASVFDFGEVPLDSALLANTVMARCADLDDGSRRAMGHPGCVLVPSSIAAAQAYHKSGEDLLCALIGGYDIYIRVGSSINPTAYRDRGFDSTGLCGAISAAAVFAKLMGESAEQIKDAMGLAALFCGGLTEYQNDGTMGKTLCGAWAAQTGLSAARLAQLGFTGPNAALEGKKAFMQAFSNEPCGDLVLDRLGESFCINEVYFKLHACMRGLHSAIDAALLLRKKYTLTPEKIKSVIVWTTPFVQRLSNPCPETLVGAQCSLQFTMAVALKYGNLSEEAMLSKSLQDREVKELAGKIECRISEDMQNYLQKHPTHWSAVCVNLEMMDGKRVSETVYLPSGEPERPLEWEILVQKFERMVENTPIYAKVRDFPQTVLSMEKLQNVNELFW